MPIIPRHTLLLPAILGAALISSCRAAAPPYHPGDKLLDVRSFGAAGDGETLDTSAIQSAIDACPSGGTVRLANGTFRSGMFKLKSNMTLDIEPYATLTAATETVADGLDGSFYPYLKPPTDNSEMHNCRRALVYGLGLSHVEITGGGTINGSGGFRMWKGKAAPERQRPIPIFIVQSKGVNIHDIKIDRSAMWSIVNMEDDDVSVRKVTVNSPDGNNRDGIDTVDCHHAVIEDDDVTSQDDSICLKTGTAKGLSDVLVKNVRIHGSKVANGLKIGTASHGPVDHIRFEDITIDNVKQAAMAVESVDGSHIHDVSFKNITFHDTGTAMYVVVGRRSSKRSGHEGSIDGVRFENITGETENGAGSAISGHRADDGSTNYLKDIELSHVHITSTNSAPPPGGAPWEYAGEYPDPKNWGILPAYGAFFRHIDGLKLTDVKWDTSAGDTRPASVMVDVKDQKK